MHLKLELSKNLRELLYLLCVQELLAVRKQLAKNRSKQQEASSGDTNLGLEEDTVTHI